MGGKHLLELLSLILSLCRPARILRWSLFLTVLVAVWVMINYNDLRAWFVVRDRRDNELHEKARLEQERDRLLKEQAQLQAGGFSAEKAVRERFKMVRPGEKIILIETPEPPKGSALAESWPEESSPTLLRAGDDPTNRTGTRRARPAAAPTPKPRPVLGQAIPAEQAAELLAAQEAAQSGKTQAATAGQKKSNRKNKQTTRRPSAKPGPRDN